MEIGKVVARGRQIWERWGDGLLALGLIAAGLILYLQTLAPSVVALFDDSLEFPLVVHRLAIAHPTGYPLYILLAKLFAARPWGNVAWGVNLLSAGAGAATVGLVYLAARQLTRRRWPALLGAVALAVSPVFWSQAVVAEVYTLNSAFVAGLVWLALRWARQPLAPVRPFSLLQAGTGSGATARAGEVGGETEEVPAGGGEWDAAGSRLGASRFGFLRSRRIDRSAAGSAGAVDPAGAEGDNAGSAGPDDPMGAESDNAARAGSDDPAGAQVGGSTSAGSDDPERVGKGGEQGADESAPVRNVGLERMRATVRPVLARVASAGQQAASWVVGTGRRVGMWLGRVLVPRAASAARQVASWVARTARQLRLWVGRVVLPQVRRAAKWLWSWAVRIGRQMWLGATRAGRWLHTIYRRFYPVVPAARRLRPHPGLYIVAAVLGLGLAHHRTVLLLVPALLLYTLLVERRVLTRAALLGPEHPERPRWLQVAGRPAVMVAAALLVPLLLYLYVPIRGHTGSLDGTYQNTWRGFWTWVMGGSYNVFLGDNPLARDLNAAFYGRLFWQQFGPVGLALGLVGAIGLVRQPKVLVLTGVALGSYVAFAVLYRVPDVEVFFIPAFVLVAVWIGAGLDYAADRLRIRGPSLAGRRLLAVTGLLVALAATAQPLALAARNYPDLDLGRQWSAHDYGRFVLEQPLPQGSTVIGLLGEMTLLRTFQETTGRRRDVRTVVADDEAARRAAVEAALQEGGAVYLTRPLPGLAADHTLDTVIGLIDAGGEMEMLARVDGPPEAPPPMLPGDGLNPLRGTIRAVGVQIEERQAHWQAYARMRVWWRTPKGMGEALKVSARLVEPGGRVIAAVDVEPVGGAYPTTAWRPGEIVADVYEIPLPAGTPPGEYAPLIVLYDPATGTERARIEWFPVHLEGNPARPPQRALEASVAETVYARFGDVTVLGLTPPNPAASYRAGESLPVTLVWQAGRPSGGELTLEFWLEGGSAYHLESGLNEAMAGGPFPAGSWERGQVVRQWAGPQVPPEVPPGTYRFKMRVLRDGQPVPWGRGLVPLGSDLELGMVEVGG